MDAETSADALHAQLALLCEHSVAPPALAPFSGLRALRARLQALAASGEAGPVEEAMLGNAFTREGRYLEAIGAYERAVALAPEFAQAHLAIAELASMLHDETRGAAHRARALALQRCFLDPLPVGDRLPIVLLLRDAAYSVNAPLELLLDRTRVAIHKCYVEGEVALPPHAVAICATGYASDAEHALARVEALAAASGRAPLDSPARLRGTARETLDATLGGIAGVHACATRVVARDAMPALALPALVRPRDTHAGRGLDLVSEPAQLEAHLRRFPASSYHVTPFVEYRSADGFYRKYRAIVVDGVAFPYHCAISPRWMVHYRGSPMREHAWMRAEEARYLNTPEREVPGWGERLAAIARALDLEYVGIDFSIAPDGTLVVFEADAAMLVHDEDPHDLFSYKRPHVARIREALHALILRRARP